MYMSNYR
ncbi:hypothetical protein SPV_2534 [Streptococcus pneumoniae]|nr:hypothetical protein SPV_2534 [Streptococcus pneumoniae]